MAYTRAQYQYYCCGLTSNTVLICDLCLSNKFKMEKSTVATLATILLYAAKISTVTADCRFIKPDYSQPPCVGLIKCSDYVTNVTDQIEFWDCRRNVYPPSEKYSLLVEVDEVSEHQIQELFANYDRYKSHITSISFTNVPVKSISAFVYSLVQATNISITYNNIDSFALNKFRLLQTLGVLNVSNNAIEILESEKCSFVLPSLRVLDLSHNLIENVPAGYFNSAPQILHLNLSYNSIEKFDDQAFAGLHLLQTLSASNNKLTQIDSTKDIGNYMKFIPRLLVNTPALTELDLSSNLITDIGPSSFNNVKLLTTLDLSDNKLQSISFDTIDLGNLTHFRVKNNLIKNVTNVLSNLVWLELLDLSYNPLENVDGQALFNLNDLKYFNASSCGINDIEFNFFNGIQNVEIIDLSHNKIKTFLVDTTNLLVVRELYLSNNELEHITSDTFFGLTRLEILELDCNKIVSIQPGSFVTAYSVHILNLHDNKLRSLQFGTFDDMNKLESLDLSKNELDSINFLIFYKTRNLISLALDDNYLSSFEYYEIRDTTIKTLSLGGNTLSCKLIMQCLRYLKGVVITAKTKNYYTENIQGVACNNATLIETSLPDIANTGVGHSFESANTSKTKMVVDSIDDNNETTSSDARMQSDFTSTSSNNFSDLKSILNKVVVCLVVIACLLLISLSLKLFKLYKSRWNRNENHVNRSGVPLMNSIEIKS